MRYQKLGNTDIDVSVIALGTWGLGGGSVWTDRQQLLITWGSIPERKICRCSSILPRSAKRMHHRDIYPAGWRCKRGAARQGIEGQKTGLYPAKQMLPELEK